MWILFIFLFFNAFCTFAYSAETDHYIYLSQAAEEEKESPTKQGKRLIFVMDATKNVNKVINGYLELLAQKVKSCKDREEVFNKVKSIFDTNFPDITNDLHLSFYEERHHELYWQNIYLNRTKLTYSNFASPSYSGCCSPVVKAGKASVGVDKIDHFLSHGFMYYKTYTEKKVWANVHSSQGANMKTVQRTDSDENRMKDVINLGLFQEESSWGLSGTGVKSYGDLAANYAGLQFYKNLIDGDNPYLKCIDDKFVVTRKFQIEDYADDSWDESLNCSSYNTKENKDTVLANMKALGFEKCPIDPEKCAVLAKKYTGAAAHILHPLCANPLSKHDQVEKPRSKPSSILRAAEFLEFKDIKKAIKGAK